MSHCSLNFEDSPDGLIDFQAIHTGGFNKDSPAHQLSIQVIKFLDEQAELKKNEQAKRLSEICDRNPAIIHL